MVRHGIEIMGIKENFTQAIKELTGAGKEKPAESSPVDELKKAVSDGDDSREFIPEPAPDWNVPDWDGSETGTVRPMKKQERSADAVPPSTPVADAFLSGQPTPASPFTSSEFAQPSSPPQAVQASQEPAQQPHKPALPPSFTEFTSPKQQEAPFVMPTPSQSAQPFEPSAQSAINSQQPFQQSPQPALPSFSGFTGGYSQNRNAFPQQSFPPRSRQEDNELTIISRNTTIDGNIRSFADMSIDGDIKGDVETTKNIDLNGKIIGNVTCNNAMMHTSQIQGNVRMKGNISMKRDTLLIGDLVSTYAELNGKVKGNLDIVGKADLKGDSIVFGDISASTITVEDGAIIQGYVSTTFLNKEESKNLFPDAIIIGDEGAATSA